MPTSGDALPKKVVKAVVRDPRGRCLLLRRSMVCKNNPGMWDFPGGKLDGEEDPGQALVREIQEETGLEVELVCFFGTAEPELPSQKVVYLIYEALSPSAEVTLSGEHDAYEWAARRRLPEYEMCAQFASFARDYAAR